MNANQVTVGAVLGGRYELTAAMASGGMAQVWRARDSVLNRPVAIKVLHPHLATDDAFVSRFRREAISSARLQHSSIVAVYDTVSENGVEAIVMELINGRTLRSILDHSGTLPPSTVVQIGIQIADAMTVAHTAGTVHRDIKPANIMIDNEMRVVVTDFGIAKATRDADLTDTGTLLGTAKYLAPEQVTGDPVDPRSDLYALGIVLFEALTGEPPFKADTDAATALARLQGPVPRCRDRSASVPAGLDAIVAKAMAVSPNDRFERAVALKDALVNADLSSAVVDDYYTSASYGAIDGRPADPTQSHRVAPDTRSAAQLPTPQQTGPTPQPIGHPPPPPASFAGPRPLTPQPTPALGSYDGTQVMSADMISGETGELEGRTPPAPGAPGTKPKRSKQALVGRGLFVVLFIAALAVAGLLAMTGGLDIGSGTALKVTAVTSADPQGADGEEREFEVINAVDRDPDTEWKTRTYGAPGDKGFAGLKSGVGLAVFFDGPQQVDEVAITTQTENWSADFYLIAEDFDTWSAEIRPSFDPAAGTFLGRIEDHSGDATVDLDDATGRGVLIWITETGVSETDLGTLFNRMTISEARFR